MSEEMIQEVEVAVKRRMPEALRKTLLRMQGGKQYLPAAYRIVWMRDLIGDDWSIETDIVEGGEEPGYAVVKATIRDKDGRILSTAHKTESRKDFPAGHVEKAETGAISRALSNMGFGTQFDETVVGYDTDGKHVTDTPQPARQAPPQDGREQMKQAAAEARKGQSKTTAAEAMKKELEEKARAEAQAKAREEASTPSEAPPPPPAKEKVEVDPAIKAVRSAFIEVMKSRGLAVSVETVKLETNKVSPALEIKALKDYTLADWEGVLKLYQTAP